MLGVKRDSVQTMTSEARDKVLDALPGVGVLPDDAHVHAKGVRRGGAPVVDSVEDAQADDAVGVLDRNNTIDIDKLCSRYRETGYSNDSSTRAV